MYPQGLHYLTNDPAIKNMVEKKSAELPWSEISTGETFKFCSKDCKFFQKPGSRGKRSSNKGKCRIDSGKVVYAGTTVCDHKTYL